MKFPDWISRKNIYIFGLALMVVSLPTSKFLMSIAQFIIIFNWLFDLKVMGKFRQFFSNRAAMVVVSVFFIHVIGVLWSADLGYASKDLRIKLPLLALPIIMSTSPKLSRSTFYNFMLLFISANVFGSFISAGKLLTGNYENIRDIFIFISHIRVGLMIALAILAGVYLFFQKNYANGLIRTISLIASAWLLIFLLISESLTGLGVLGITALLLLIVFVFKQKRYALRVAASVLLISVPLGLFIWLQNLQREIVPQEPFYHVNLQTHTSRGNPYTHDSTLIGFENGYWVGRYIQNWELATTWNKRSDLHFEGLDLSGQQLRITLMRYLTSKGLRKDADGVDALSDEDIAAIESGIASVDIKETPGIINRIKIVIWELELFRHYGYLKGHSVAQRLEFWRAGLHIISQNPLFGVGTGDIDHAFKEAYREMQTQLPPGQWWRTHNQYLTVFATLGIFGLLWFIFALIYPAIRLKMFNDYFYFVFFCIAVISMITGDTLDTQAGVTFYAFFTSLFLFARREKDLLRFN
jgi:hypothetical protein